MLKLSEVVLGLVRAIFLGIGCQMAGAFLVWVLSRVIYGVGESYYGGNFTSEEKWLYMTLGPLTENGSGAVVFYALLWQEWRQRPFWHGTMLVVYSFVTAYFAHTRYDNIEIWGVMPLFFAMPLQFLYDRPRVGGPLAFLTTVVTHIVNNAFAVTLDLAFR